MIFLLDTDTLSHLQRGNERLIRRIKGGESGEFAISIVTRIEMLRGRFDHFLKAASAAEVLRAQHLLVQTEVALQQLELLPFDLSAAVEFDRLDKAGLSRKVGRADLLIASVALAHKAILVTRNLRHFRQVPGLRVENWVDG